RRGDVIDRDGQIFVRVERAVTRVPGGGFRVGPPKSEAGVRVVALPRRSRRRSRPTWISTPHPDPTGCCSPHATAATWPSQRSRSRGTQPAPLPVVMTYPGALSGT